MFTEPMGGILSPMKKFKADLSKTDFRMLLQQELVERIRLNPSYSLRAFARHLDIEPSHLSKILTNKRPVSEELFEKMAKRLGLSLAQIESLKTKLPKRWDRQKQKGIVEAARRNNYHQIPLDTFEIISDWHHYAILELLKIKGFKPDLKWVSEKLGISTSKTRYIVDRLVRVGLLSISNSGNWNDLSEGFSTHVLGENYTSYAHKKAQAEILRLALHALNELPIERRDQSSTMISTNTKKLQEAKKMIKAFRLNLTDFLEDCEEKNVIYQLSVSLFPLVESQE